MSDQVAWELMTIANYLMIKKPEATFRDLLLIYLKHKTGVDYSKYL